MDSGNAPAARKSLGLWDATSLIVGIIIGVGIFQTPPTVFKELPELIPSLLPWIAGGVITLLGALCFAELASTYPRSGGEYVYLSRAFGPPPMVGFLYAWTQLLVIRPGSIGAMAYISAFHLGALFGTHHPTILLALSIGAILLLTVINVLGVRLGATVQNLLTVLKIVGLVGIIAIGFAWGRTDRALATGPVHFEPFAGAMVLVLWTYAGWNEAAYVASEVHDARRNLTLSLILGTAIVTALYLVVNVALSLGLDPADAQSPDAAAKLVSLAWPKGGSFAMSVIIFVSALGALNGTIFTTARICVAFGTDHAFFAGLAHWSPRLKTPVAALVAQMAVSVVLVAGIFVPIFAEWETLPGTWNVLSQVRVADGADMPATSKTATIDRQKIVLPNGDDEANDVLSYTMTGSARFGSIEMTVEESPDPNRVGRQFRGMVNAKDGFLEIHYVGDSGVHSLVLKRVASDPFEGLVAITSAIFWLTFLLTGLALFVLRRRDRDLPRHFRVPGYPVVPILFCLSCAYMVYASISYAPILSAIGVGILIGGVPIFYLSGGHRPRPGSVALHELDEAIRSDVDSRGIR